MVDGARPQRARRPPLPRQAGDREVLRSRYQQIPDMRWEEMQHWICSPDKALSEWVVRGTPIGGEPFAYTGCDLWEFRDGYVTKKDTYWKYIG